MKEHLSSTISKLERIRQEYKEVYFNYSLVENHFIGDLPNHIDKVIIFNNLNLQNLHDNLCDKVKFDKILYTETMYDYN